MRKVRFALCFALFLSPLSIADELAQLKKMVAQSLTSFEDYDRKQWAYTLAREIGHGKEKLTMLESYDPAKPKNQQWTLIKEYGKPPSENRQSEYQDLKQAEQTQADAKQAEQKLIEMVQLDSLQLIEKNQHIISLAFTPKLPNMPPEAIDKLTGLLLLDSQNQYVRKMKISNIDELSPAQNVTLSYFSMAFEFTQVDKMMLPQNIAIDFKGKMAFSKPISQHSVETYSDYRFVGSQKTTAAK